MSMSWCWQVHYQRNWAKELTTTQLRGCCRGVECYGLQTSKHSLHQTTVLKLPAFMISHSGILPTVVNSCTRCLSLSLISVEFLLIPYLKPATNMAQIPWSQIVHKERNPGFKLPWEETSQRGMCSEGHGHQQLWYHLTHCWWKDHTLPFRKSTTQYQTSKHLSPTPNSWPQWIPPACKNPNKNPTGDLCSLKLLWVQEITTCWSAFDVTQIWSSR